MRDFLEGEIHIWKRSNCPFFRTKGGGSRGSDGPTERGVQLFLLRSHSHKSFPFFFFCLRYPPLISRFPGSTTFSTLKHFSPQFQPVFFPPFFKPLAPKTCSSPRNRPRPRDRPFFGGTLHTLWGWKIQFQQQQQQQRFSRSLFRINTLTNTKLSLTKLTLACIGVLLFEREESERANAVR